MHAEILLDVFRERMHLETQVAATHRVEKIEADGKFVAETRMHFFAQQRAGLIKNQINGGNFQPRVAETEQQRIFLRHAVETPAVILRAAVEIANFLHPLAAPRRGIEEWHDAKRLRHCLTQTAPDSFTLGELRLARIVCVEDEIPFGDERSFPAIAHTPVHKERAFVLQIRGERFVVCTEVVRFVAAVAQLAFPARHVGINQNISIRHLPCAAPDDENQTGLFGCDYFAQHGNLVCVKKFRQRQAGKETEHRIVAAEERCDQRVNLFRRQQRLTDIQC